MKNIFLSISIISIIVIGYFSIDFNSLYNKYFDDDKKYEIIDYSCDLHKSACSLVVENTNITLELFPKEIPLMKDLYFTLKSDKVLENTPKMKIYATNMFMGEFNIIFEKVDDYNYKAKGMLPACTVGNMQWNADVDINKDINARFQFTTK